jgi:hypothetical protein
MIGYYRNQGGRVFVYSAAKELLISAKSLTALNGWATANGYSLLPL